MYSNKVICKIRTIMTQRSESVIKYHPVAPAHYVWINALCSAIGGVGGGVGNIMLALMRIKKHGMPGIVSAEVGAEGELGR
jgi:hypothetical protein